jgi:hypothetical protein
MALCKNEYGGKNKMKVIKHFVQEFGVRSIKPRKMGNQYAFYVPTIDAANFFGKELEVFPLRYIDENEELGLVFYLDMPDDYFYKPYSVYKLKRPYKLADGEPKMTYSYYVPIPNKMLSDIGIENGVPRIIEMKGGYLPDGKKVILIQRKKVRTEKRW